MIKGLTAFHKLPHAHQVNLEIYFRLFLDACVAKKSSTAVEYFSAVNAYLFALKTEKVLNQRDLDEVRELFEQVRTTILN